MASHKQYNELSAIERGFQAEQRACRFLEKQGMTFIEQNYRIAKVGEIDLIMQDNNHLVFIEVKYRHDGDFGLAIDMIGKLKQSRLIRTAKYYLQEKKLLEKVFCRFDVIAIMFTYPESITWIKNAFEVEY